MQSVREGSITADWLNYWNLNTQPGNPPYPNRISEKLDYLQVYAIDAAYIPRQRRTESNRMYKKRIYVSLHALLIVTSNRQEMRIEKQWPHTDWKTIWKNLTITPTSVANKMNWYKVMHDIIPTNVRLHRIRISPTDNCSECNNTDTLSQTNRMWRKQNALGMDTKDHSENVANISDEYTARMATSPDFCLWPPQRQRSVLWLLSRDVNFTLSRRGKQDPQDLMDFLRRSQWKTQQMPGRRKLLANFLTVIDTFQY